MAFKSIENNLKKEDIDPKNFKTYYKFFIQYNPYHFSEKEILMKPYHNIKSKI